MNDRPILVYPESAPRRGTIWQHYKGTTYRVLGLVWLTEMRGGLELRDANAPIEFARPLAIWAADVAPGVCRFTPVQALRA